MTSDGAQELEQLLAELAERTAERRARGEYPPGLDERLDDHFRRLTKTPPPISYDELDRRIAEAGAWARFNLSTDVTASELPGGARVHAIVGRLVERHLHELVNQLQGFASSVTTALEEIGRHLRDPAKHSHPDLLGEVDALWDRLAPLDRLGGEGSNGAVIDLANRVEALESTEASRDWRSWFDPDRFNERFRGQPEDLREVYRGLANLFVGCDRVIDLGCGGGEFLDLLRGAGVNAEGIELDERLASRATARGLTVTHGDLMQFLWGVDDGAFDGAVMLQVIEHLAPQDVLDLVPLLYAKISPGGTVVVETVNPQSLYVYARAFYLDPTHTTPVHPAYLEFLFKEAGFSEVAIEWRSEPPDSDRLMELPDDVGDAELRKILNEDIERLNRLVFAPQDYAVIATR